MNQKYIGAALRVALLWGASLGPVAATWAQEKEIVVPSIVVSGVGEVKVKPDIARLELGVQTKNKDSAKAVQQNAAIADAVIKAIKAAGIADADLQTAGYSIYPDYEQQTTPAGGSRPVMSGYQVSNTVRVVVRKLGDTGKVIDGATKAGANWAGGISLDLNDADKKKAQSEALRKAVAEAREKADIMASAASVTNLRLITLTADSGGYSPVPMMAGRAMMKADVATPIVAGEQIISASVTARYGFSFQ